MKAPRFQSAIQRMLFAAERYREHELANHAAATGLSDDFSGRSAAR